MDLFRLDWTKDSAGYHIEEPPDMGPMIVRNGGPDTRPQQPLRAPGLCRWLAEADKTPEGALNLVSRWGFLFTAEMDDERVFDICEGIDLARRLLALEEAKDWPAFAELLDHLRTDDPIFSSGGLGALGVQFLIEPGTDRPRLRLRPGNLFNAIMVQFLAEVSRSAKLKPCARPTCPEWFEYGAGTRKRSTAFYHSPKCQKAHEYERRKQKESQP